MYYAEVSLNSELYHKMSNVDKLRVVKAKLNCMFLYKGKDGATVVYKDTKKVIDNNMVKIYKNLLEREKALEKIVPRKNLYTLDHNSVFYSKLSLDEKIEVMEDKLFYFSEINLHSDRYVNEKYINITYNGFKLIIPEYFQLHALTVLKKLDELNEQKKEKEAEFNSKFEQIEASVNASANSYIGIKKKNVSKKTENKNNKKEATKTNKKKVVHKESRANKRKDAKKENKNSIMQKVLYIGSAGIEGLKNIGKFSVGLVFVGCSKVYDYFKHLKFKRNVKKADFEIVPEKINEPKVLALEEGKGVQKVKVRKKVKPVQKVKVRKKVKPVQKVKVYKKEKLNGKIKVYRKIGNINNVNVIRRVGVLDNVTVYRTFSNNKTKIMKKQNIGRKYILPFVLGIGAFCKNIYSKTKNFVVSSYKTISTKVSKFFSSFKKDDRNRTTVYDNSFKKRVAAFLCASVIVLTAVLPFAKNNKKANLDDGKKEPTTQTDPVEDVITTKPTIGETIPDEEIIVPPTTGKDDETIINGGTDTVLDFEDVVTIEDDAHIYTNSYDATYESNAYNPYYNGGYDRDVQGIVYELNGNIYVIYENDVNAYEKHEKYMAEGAKITAVLVSRCDKVESGDYEGYYNINSVKIKTKQK